MVVCRLCGKSFKLLTNTHLKSHGMTADDYLSAYPGASMVSDETRARLTTSATKSNSARKGVKRDPEHVRKMAEAQRRRFAAGAVAHNKGQSMSDEQRAKLANTVREQYASGEREHWNQRGTAAAETRAKISQSLSGRTLSDDHRQSIATGLGEFYEGGGVSPMTGKRHTAQARTKITESLKRRYENKEQVTREQLDAIATQNCITILNIVNNYYVHMQCDICATEFEYTKQVFLPSKNNGEELCPTCFPRNSGSSAKEKAMADFIRDVYSGPVIVNDRKVLGGKEIDILLPELSIGFEFTGLYWHSELGGKLDKNHLLWKKQFAHTRGIKLYTVFEDEWDEKRDIVKSRIRSILGLIAGTAHARKCQVRHIDNSTKNEFLERHHIQGKDVSGIRYGAYHGDELVAVMTFTKTNYVKGGDGSEYELNRFCTLSGLHIPGIASKLLTAFIREYSPTSVISYADSRWSNGNVYRTLGFRFEHSSPPSYWYIENYKSRYHRSRFMKHTLKDLPNYGDERTEWAIMAENGYDRIWDCGTTKWRLVPD
jgi:hypothetical protein